MPIRFLLSEPHFSVEGAPVSACSKAGRKQDTNTETGFASVAHAKLDSSFG